MGTRAQAIEVLAQHMGESVASGAEQDTFCQRFNISPFKDGWLFQTHAPKKGATPMWWMVVGSGVHGFHFFKMANPRAYAKARELAGVLVH